MDADRSSARRTLPPRTPWRRAALALVASAGALLCACEKYRDVSDRSAAPAAAREVAHPDVVGRWTPGAAPSFITVDRDTSVALVEGNDDLLLLVTEKAPDRHSPAVSRVTWILEIPSDAAPDDRFAFLGEGAGRAPRGWVVERHMTDERTTRLELGGFVTVLERDDASLVVDLKLFPIDAPETPDLLEQVVFHRVNRPQAAATPALETRSGVALKPHEGPPARKPTDSVWPFGEIAGEYPPPKHGDEALHPQ